MSYYPIVLDLKEKKIIVVGGGSVAQRKIETLMVYGADIHVIARQLTPTLQNYVMDERIKHIDQEFTGKHLDGVHLAIAATDDHSLNRRISLHARERGILINAVDQPEDCNFYVPSILRRGDLQIAVSTSGKSPALARKIREDLEKIFGGEYEDLLILLGRLRKDVLSWGFSHDKNGEIFNRIVRSDIFDAMVRKDWHEITSILNDILQTRLTPDDIAHYLK